MSHALRMGRRALGQCWPNPAVGCVIVNDGVVVGRGWTQPGGRPHAERVAMAMAGEAVKGATVYVTLEPCSHHGVTPPCADALIAAGVARVVAAVEDRDPRVSGKGFAKLRAAGIEVTTGVLADAATADHAGFFLRETEGRPWVTLKLALSFDGRIATATGESQWITGPEARRQVHLLRGTHDAVMVGAGTARADDPQLNVRGLGARRQPARVVVSRSLDVPLTGHLATGASDPQVFICHGTDARPEMYEAWQGLGARLLPCRVVAGRVDPLAVLNALAEQGITRVFCEGGGQLAASMLSVNLVDELHVFTAGLALGAEGYPGLGALGIDRLADAPRLELKSAEQVGADVHLVWQKTRSV